MVEFGGGLQSLPLIRGYRNSGTGNQSTSHILDNTAVSPSALRHRCFSFSPPPPLTSLKRCGFTSLPLPKDILQHCSLSLAITSMGIKVFVKTLPKPFAGTSAHNQRVTLTLHLLCGGVATDSFHSHARTRENKSLRRRIRTKSSSSNSSTNQSLQDISSPSMTR